MLREPAGEPLATVDRAWITDDVLTDAWTNLGLHGARIAHGEVSASHVLLRYDGSTAFVDFAHALRTRRLNDARDSAALLATTAALVGNTRALAAAQHALGNDGLDQVMPLLTPVALSAETRREIPETKALLNSLRNDGAALTGTPLETVAELRRVSPGNLLMAAGAMLGIYLLFGELAGIDYSEVFSTAEWRWVLVAFLLSPIPQFATSIALMGAVATPLPVKPVLGEQFANNFTGLVGGTVANTAARDPLLPEARLVGRRRDQLRRAHLGRGGNGAGHRRCGRSPPDRQRLHPVGERRRDIGLDHLVVHRRGADRVRCHVHSEAAGAVKNIVAPEWHQARDNLKGILSTPRKAMMLFGGNLAAQVLFALVLDASLHAFGESLPLLQIMVINSLASVLGGMAPIPGGMGVVEAGMIAGLTAAGIPQEQAVAATSTHRLFTAYLPPVWGWFVLQWLRRNEYV